MIWFFLMGMIAGAVGMVMIATWWVKNHVQKVSADEMIQEIQKTKEDETHD